MAYRSYRGFRLNVIWLLIGVNLLLFIATLVEQDLIWLLGLQPATFLGRPWTLVTNLFVHGGIGHILANMLTLYFFGSYLARLIGVRNFLIIYFCGGILGNIFYILLASPFSIAVGASGAIFALGGTLTVMRPRLRVFIFPIPVPLPLWVAVIGGFLILSLFPHVAWQAHLGGLVLGLIAGYFLRKRARYFY
ncbi:MAG: rhomboid family intramembrane serine protease [Dehalococcoidia bacterium]|nr:rhomboid family intramembrane serine protease [Dehalococcoidia bacterium]